MGASVSQDLLQKGLKGAGGGATSETIGEVTDSQEDEAVCVESEEREEELEALVAEEEAEEVYGDENANLYDEYEYDEYEYDEY
jgi:hypothetical protein